MWFIVLFVDPHVGLRPPHDDMSEDHVLMVTKGGNSPQDRGRPWPREREGPAP